MQHAHIVAVRDGRYEDVDRREAVMTGPCKLALCVERDPLDVVVDREMRESTQLAE